MNSSHLEGNIASLANGSPICASPPHAELVLRELCHLLEEYGPAWYTEELHHRAVLALGDVPNHRSSSRREMAVAKTKGRN